MSALLSLSVVINAFLLSMAIFNAITIIRPRSQSSQNLSFSLLVPCRNEAENATELALRVAVRPGGCSGYSYEMFFDGEFASDDMVQTFGDVKVVVDPASLQLLEGANLDYNDGLQDAGFKITNPNASRSCGCGQSFS